MADADTKKNDDVTVKSRDLKDIEKHLTTGAAALQKIAKPVVAFLTVAIPIVITTSMKAYSYFQKLPQNMINLLIGFVLCFFGGLYPVVFAAIQAAEYGGRKTVMLALKDLASEAMAIIEESKKDDEVDADNDGKADVKQISNKDFMVRKTMLVFRKMNPEKVDAAIHNIYKVWLSVAAVLTIQFAQAIAMALSIADFLRKPVDRFIAPTIQLAVPDEYDKWVPVILGWICKAIGMSLAWYIQAVRSAFAAALTGGDMMGKAIYKACTYRGITLGGLIDLHDDKNSYVDEFLAYTFAALGFFFQFKIGFRMPFPFNLLLFPFEFAEYYIRWSITKATGSGGAI